MPFDGGRGSIRWLPTLTNNVYKTINKIYMIKFRILAGFMSESVAPDTVGILTKRGHLLDVLVDESASRSELRNAFDESRSTIYRGLAQLESRGLITEEDGEYRATTVGKLLFEEYRTFLDTVESVWDERELFRTSRAIADSFPVAALRDGDVLVSDEHAPAHVFRRLRSTIESADSIRGVVPAVLPASLDWYRSAMADDAFEVEVVFSEPAFEYLLDVERESLDELVSSDHCVVRRTTAEVPFGVLLDGDPTEHVVCVVHGEVGSIRGLVVSDAPAVVGWANDRFERYRAASTRYRCESAEVVSEAP